MKIPEVIFREYDIRGIVGEQVDAPLAAAIGRAFTTLLRSQGYQDPGIAVGRDNRPSSELLASAVRDGICAAGGTAIDIGELPTPALYFAVHHLKTDGGLQVTGSHNPSEFNGFKMLSSDTSIHGEAIQQIGTIIKEDSADPGSGHLKVNTTIMAGWVDAILERNGPLKRPVKVVVDCGNGVAALMAESLLTRLGAEVVPLFCESDGTFPNHHPDPTVIENLKDLQEAVRREGAEIGIAFDGDGDRIGAVDETGKVIFGDQLLILLGRDLVKRQGPGHSVIFEVKCSQVLADELTKSGLKPVIWKTGHSLIKSKMKELNAPLAGEMSGHMFFAGDYFGYDDAPFAAARLLDFLSQHPGPMSSLMSDIPVTVTTPELRIDCPDEEKFQIVQKACEHFAKSYEVLTLDGARITFANGWGLIRASNTQPVIVMRFEAGDAEELAAYRGEVEEWLAGQGVSV